MKKIIIAVLCALIVVIAGILVFNAVNNTETTTQQQVEEMSGEVSGEEADKVAEESEEKAEESASQPQNEAETDTTADTEEKVYTPTFMFFVSNSDEGFEATNKIVEELKKEYDKRVTFDIVNIDEKPEAKDNFPVDGNTPFLIMLNTKNDISAFRPFCNNKKDMIDTIEAALNS